MYQRLRCFVPVGMVSEELVVKSLNAGSEEHFYLMVQIEKPDAKKRRQFSSNGRLANASNACQENAHCCYSMPDYPPSGPLHL
jgi:hypothetical protein